MAKATLSYMKIQQSAYAMSTLFPALVFMLLEAEKPASLVQFLLIMLCFLIHTTS